MTRDSSPNPCKGSIISSRIEPARHLAAEALKLETTLRDLVNQAYGLTPEEINLMLANHPPSHANPIAILTAPKNPIFNCDGMAVF